MAQRSFTVRAIWDDEAKVYVSESDIEGLHIEAASLDEFEAMMMEMAPELILVNHFSRPQMMSLPPKDWVPAIIWRRPDESAACA